MASTDSSSDVSYSSYSVEEEIIETTIVTQEGGGRRRTVIHGGQGQSHGGHGHGQSHGDHDQSHEGHMQSHGGHMQSYGGHIQSHEGHTESHGGQSHGGQAQSHGQSHSQSHGGGQVKKKPAYSFSDFKIQTVYDADIDVQMRDDEVEGVPQRQVIEVTGSSSATEEEIIEEMVIQHKVIRSGGSREKVVQRGESRRIIEHVEKAPEPSDKSRSRSRQSSSESSSKSFSLSLSIGRSSSSSSSSSPSKSRSRSSSVSPARIAIQPAVSRSSSSKSLSSSDHVVEEVVTKIVEVVSEPKKNATFRVKRSQRKVFHEEVVHQEVEEKPPIVEKKVVKKQQPKKIVQKRKPLPEWQDVYVEEKETTPPPLTAFGGGGGGGGGFAVTHKTVNRSSSSSSSERSSLTDFIVVERPYLEEWRDQYKKSKKNKKSSDSLTACNNDICWETHTAQCNDQECWDYKSNMIHYHKGDMVIYKGIENGDRADGFRWDQAAPHQQSELRSSESFSSSDDGGRRSRRKRRSSTKFTNGNTYTGGEVVISQQESSQSGKIQTRKGYGRKFSDLFKDNSSSSASSSSDDGRGGRVRRQRSKRVSSKEIRVVSGDSSSSSEGIVEEIRDIFDGSSSSSSSSKSGRGSRIRTKSKQVVVTDIYSESNRRDGGDRSTLSSIEEEKNRQKTRQRTKDGSLRRISQTIHEAHSDSHSGSDEHRKQRRKSPIRKAHDYDDSSESGRSRDSETSDKSDKGHETCEECDCCIRPCSRAQSHTHNLILGDDYCDRHKNRIKSTNEDTYVCMQADRRVEDYEKNRRRDLVQHVVDEHDHLEDSVYRKDFDPKQGGEICDYDNRNLKDTVREMYQDDSKWETTNKESYIEYDRERRRSYKDKNTKDHIVLGSDTYQSQSSYDKDYAYYEGGRSANFKNKNTKDHVSKVFCGDESMERRDDYGTWDYKVDNEEYERNRIKGTGDKIKFGNDKFAKTTSYDREFRYREAENNDNYKRKNTKDHIMDKNSEHFIQRKNEYGNFDHSTISRSTQQRNVSTICLGDDKSRIRRPRDYGVFNSSTYYESCNIAERNKQNSQGTTILGSAKNRFSTSYGHDFAEKKIVKSMSCKCNNCPNCHISSRTRKPSCPKCVTETTTGKRVENSEVVQRGRSRQRSDVHYHVRKSPSPTRRTKGRRTHSSIVFGGDNDTHDRYGRNSSKRNGKTTASHQVVKESSSHGSGGRSSSHFVSKEVINGSHGADSHSGPGNQGSDHSFGAHLSRGQSGYESHGGGGKTGYGSQSSGGLSGYGSGGQNEFGRHGRGGKSGYESYGGQSGFDSHGSGGQIEFGSHGKGSQSGYESHGGGDKTGYGSQSSGGLSGYGSGGQNEFGRHGRGGQVEFGSYGKRGQGGHGSHGGYKNHSNTQVTEYTTGGSNSHQGGTSFSSRTEHQSGGNTFNGRSSNFHGSTSASYGTSHQHGGGSSSGNVAEYQDFGRKRNNTFTKQQNVVQTSSSGSSAQDSRNAARNTRLRSQQSNWSFGGMSSEENRHDRFKPNHRIIQQRNRSQIFW